MSSIIFQYTGVDPGFLDRRFKFAAEGLDLTIQPIFSNNFPWKCNNLDSQGGSTEPPDPPLNPPLVQSTRFTQPNIYNLSIWTGRPE